MAGRKRKNGVKRGGRTHPKFPPLPAVAQRPLPFSVVHLLGFVAACELVGIAGAAFTTPAVASWYALLLKPSLAPPAWVFGPAWTALYALMGASAYLAFRRPDSGNRSSGLRLFSAQLMLNLLWSTAFFGLHSPALGMVVITLLWFSIAATIAYFWRVSKAASVLLMPYLLWVSLAAALNYGVWLLNA